MRIVKKILLTALIFSMTIAAGPVLANDCETEIEAANELLEESAGSISIEDRNEVEALIRSAIQLCQFEKNDRALEKLQQARDLLGG